MTTPKDFIESYIIARTAECVLEFELRTAFRMKYFAVGCTWDSRSGIVETSAQEVVSEVVDTTDGIAVKAIPEKTMPPVLYHLRPKGE